MAHNYCLHGLCAVLILILLVHCDSYRHCLQFVSGNTVFINNDSNCSLEYFLCQKGFLSHTYIRTLNLSSQHHHTISSGPYCLLENLTNITIQSDNSSQSVLVICSIPWRGFGFFNFSNLQLIGLTFHQCGGEIYLTDAARRYTNESRYYFGPHQKAVLLISYSNDTVLESVSIKGPYAGFGIVLINLVGLTKAKDIDISNNVPYHSNVCLGSGLVIISTDKQSVVHQVGFYGENKIYSNYNCHLSSTPFRTHFHLPKQSIVSAVGITVVIATNNAYITFSDVTIFNNTSYDLPIVFIIFHSTRSSVFLNTLNFTQNKAAIGSLDSSGVYILTFTMHMVVNTTNRPANQVRITSSTFHNNTNTQVVFVEAFLPNYCGLRIYFTSAIFALNRVSSKGACIYGVHNDFVLVRSGFLSFYIEDTVVKDCHRPYKGEIGQVSALKFVNIEGVLIRGSHFSNNIGTAIECYNSMLTLANINTFINNTGFSGGGISLRAFSLLYIYDDIVQVTFINNTAVAYGGGIYSEYLGINRCFFDESFVHQRRNITLVNNVALLSGNAVYADSLFGCNSTTVMTIFHPIPNNNFALVSKPAYIYECSIAASNAAYVNVTMYPGEQITIGLSAYDAARNPVYADAFVKLGIRSWSLEEGEYVRRLYPGICNKIHIKLAVNNGIDRPVHQTVKLYTSSQACFYINVKMTPCPVGLDINSNGFCSCNKFLHSISEHFKSIITCTGTNISLPNNAWFGVSLTNKQAFSFVCHHGYCSLTAVYDALNTDSLCLYERTGITCGACRNEFSTVFGSDECLVCSNIWLITIVGYAIAGLLIVLILFLLKMTVSNGILGGLVFFANMCIVNEHDQILSHSVYTYPFSIALSFLNLNLGFRLCFYDGMTTVMKVGLQFAFPIYLWLLVLFLVISSRFSSCLTNLIVDNSVQVLATLFQFSFAKLLSTITMIFTSVKVYDAVKSSELRPHTMWFYDGNIEYLKEGHLILFVLATMTASLFIIPYLIITCCASKLVRFHISHYFHPLIDAYHGPYKVKCGYWLGVRQFLIVASYGLYAGLRGTRPLLLISLQTISVAVFMIVQSHLKPFKNKFVGLLDMWFVLLLFMLNIMVAMFLYGSKQSTGTPYIMGILGVYLVTVAIVFMYHILSAMRCTRLWLQQSSFWRYWDVQNKGQLRYGTFSHHKFRESILETTS